MHYLQKEYLGRRTIEYGRKILGRHAHLKFPEALGSVDCSVWEMPKGALSEQLQNTGKVRAQRAEWRGSVMIDFGLAHYRLAFLVRGTT